MAEQNKTSSKQNTIFLAILFFGGFTLLLIFYLIYKYFRMRRNDIQQRRLDFEQRQRIQKHNELQKEKFRKKQEQPLSQNILTQSIINWTNNTINVREGACQRCHAFLNTPKSFDNIEEIKSGISIKIPLYHFFKRDLVDNFLITF